MRAGDSILRVATEGLHRWRGHDRRRTRWADALATGGLSLIFGRASCSCKREATVVIAALLDGGYVVVDEVEHNQFRDAFIVQEVRRGPG